MTQLMTVETAAKRLLLCDEGVRRFIKRRELKAAKIGRKYLIAEDDLEEFIQSQMTGNDR